ncbi:MAG TPA: tRNA-dihydrouridine synthase [Candidatus Paceibacterota bacterium]|nr:tRNA-dihydrouridine synthase [Candidatus Paceibacterota bacterium]
MNLLWETLPKPFFALAPLANVTDAAFRRVIAKYSKPEGPHLMFTEFVSADGLMRGNREVLLKDLQFTEGERPIIAQFFTSDPLMMEKAAALAMELGFDGVDINMGCPDRSVEKQGAGAKLILNPERAQELIAAAKRGAPELPISVKTRLGYNKDILEEWLPELLKAEPAAITIHARTRKEMSKVDAHWDRIKRAVEIRNGFRSPTRIIGNGDVKDLEDAKRKAHEAGAEGVMLGRAIFGKPWLFGSLEPSLEARLAILVEHTKLFEKILGDVKNFSIMKKHFKAYVEGFEGAKELRVQLMDAKNAQEVEKILGAFSSKLQEVPITV